RQSARLLRTGQDALKLLRRERVLTLTPAGRPRSLVGEIAGEVRGSWWGHPDGKLIYSIATHLEDSPEVLGAKLVNGKVSFVHRGAVAAARPGGARCRMAAPGQQPVAGACAPAASRGRAGGDAAA